MSIDQQLVSLLNDVTKKENSRRNKIVLATILPILTALALLYYFSTKIMASRNQVQALNQKVDSLNTVLSNYNKQIDSINKIYKGVEFNFTEDFGWTPKDVIGKDSLKIVISQKAHSKIIEFLKLQKVNTKSTVRYYTKASDKGKIDQTLLKCGFRNIKIFTTYYRDKSPTNTIHYSKDVSDENIKVVAFALLRAGIDLKAIIPYPKAVQKFKHHSIEISGTKEFEGNNSITITDIDVFCKQ